MKLKIRGFINHFFNPLHVYCRLIDVKVSQVKARHLCLKYETLYKRVMAF